MIKIKVKDKEDYVSSSVKYKDTTVLELIELIDKAMCLLKDEHGMSEEKTLDVLKSYREQIEEVV